MIIDNKIFNKYKNKLVSLGEGEEFCKKCKGKGMVSIKGKFHNPFSSTKYHTLRCSVCLGDGKIDWIEKVTGKPKTPALDGTDCYTPSS